MQKQTKHVTLSDDENTGIYCKVENFCKFFNEIEKGHTLRVSDRKRHRDKPSRLSNADVMTILIDFHMGTPLPEAILPSL